MMTQPPTAADLPTFPVSADAFLAGHPAFADHAAALEHLPRIGAPPPPAPGRPVGWLGR